MQIKHYYIISKAVLMANTHLFFGQGHAHDIESGTDEVIVCGSFADEWAENNFASLPTCHTLPHLHIEGNKPLSAAHVAKLKNLGVANGHTVIDLVKLLKTKHPLMGVSGLR